MANFPTPQPINTQSPWMAIPEALSKGVDSYWNQRSLQMAMQQKAMQRLLQESEIRKNQMTEAALRGKTSGVADPGNPTVDLLGQPMPEPNNPAPASPGLPGVKPQPGPSLAPTPRTQLKDAQGNPIDTAGMSANDINKLRVQLATGRQTGGFSNYRADKMAGAMAARANISSLSSAITSPESVKLDSSKVAAPLLREKIDLRQAYNALQSGNPNTAATSWRQLLSKHPTISAMLQQNGSDPNKPDANSLISIDRAVSNQLAREYPRLMNGSTANPTDTEIESVMNANIPNIMDKEEAFKGKTKTILDSGIYGAYGAALSKLGSERDLNGNFVTPSHANIYRNRNAELQGYQKMFSDVGGDNTGGPSMPLSQGGMDIRSLAQQALKDPSASPEHKAAAKQILGIQ